MALRATMRVSIQSIPYYYRYFPCKVEIPISISLHQAINKARRQRKTFTKPRGPLETALNLMQGQEQRGLAPTIPC